jgi:hypothetical protein
MTVASSLLLQVLAITNTTVIDPLTTAVQRDVTVLVRGTRIESVARAAATRVPSGARVIDGRGKYLIPGLWDMHVHMDVPGGRALLPMYVVNGVTGVRDMDGDLAKLRTWQAGVASGEIVGPRMVISGPYLVGGRVPIPHIFVETPEQAVQAVDSLARLRVDFVKVHNGMPPAAYFAAAREARRRGLVFAGHVFPPVTPLQAADSGQRSLEHLSGFPNECVPSDSVVMSRALRLQRFLFGPCTAVDQQHVYDYLATRPVWVTPTLIVQTELVHLWQGPQAQDSLRRFFGDSLRTLWRLMMPLPAEVPPGATEAGALFFQRRLEIVRDMHRAGVPLLAGSDAPSRASPPGVSIHDELALLVRAGLPPMAALRTATAEPARYLGADSLGSVAAGRIADLVLLDADPLTDIANTRRISAIVANGRVFTADDRRALLEGVARAAR